MPRPSRGLFRISSPLETRTAQDGQEHAIIDGVYIEARQDLDQLTVSADGTILINGQPVSLNTTNSTNTTVVSGNIVGPSAW